MGPQELQRQLDELCTEKTDWLCVLGVRRAERLIGSEEKLTPAHDPQRVDGGGAARRNDARQCPDDQEQQRHRDKRERVVGVTSYSCVDSTRVSHADASVPATTPARVTLSP